MLFFFPGKWCQRRDWPPPLDARAASAAEAAKRGLLYQSVFLGGSPNDYNSCKYLPTFRIHSLTAALLNRGGVYSMLRKSCRVKSFSPIAANALT